MAPVIATPLPPPERLIYVLDPNGGELLSRILAIDPDMQRVAFGIRTRYLPSVTFSPDGHHLYVIDTYSTQVTRGEERDVFSVYDALTGKLVVDDTPAPPGRVLYKIFPLGQPFLFFSDDGSSLYLMQYGDPDVHKTRLAVLDPDTFQVLREGTWPLACGRPVWALADRWICASTTGSIDSGFSVLLDAVDPQTGEVVDHLLTVENTDAASLALSSDGKLLYVVGRDAVVTVIDMPSRTVLERAELAVNDGRVLTFENIAGIAHVPDGKRLYLGFANKKGPNYNGLVNEIWVYDTTNWERVARMETRDPVMHFALSVDGDQLYAVSPQGQSLTIYDTDTYSEIAVLTDLGGTPARLLLPPASP
ncbi:MAG: hypothetical protein IH955_03530 [Chloroflexi bacterium]|nr:hypothetical protein [Chloroflexota bacterium]